MEGTTRFANAAGAPGAKEKSLLEAQLGQIEYRLKGLDDIENQIGMAVGRLLNPRPADAGQDMSPVPSASTVEGRLQNIVLNLDVLTQRLSNQADTLNKAI